jgi:AcrR family transcriptional regulator
MNNTMHRNRRSSTQSTPQLAPQQLEVISALARGASVSDAAKHADISRATFYCWLGSDARFKAELNRAKQEHSDFVRAQLGELADTAVSTIREMLTGTATPPGIRLKAALAVLQRIGTLHPEEIGNTDPAAIKEEMMFGFSDLFR